MASVPAANSVVIRRPLLEVWGPPLFMLVMMAGFVWYVTHYVVPSVHPPSPVVDVTAEGKGYAIDRTKNYVAGLRAMAKSCHDHKPLTDGTAAMASQVKSANEADFVKRFGPILQTITAEGKDPATDDQWAKMEQFYTHLADGCEQVPGVK